MESLFDIQKDIFDNIKEYFKKIQNLEKVFRNEKIQN